MGVKPTFAFSSSSDAASPSRKSEASVKDSLLILEPRKMLAETALLAVETGGMEG